MMLKKSPEAFTFLGGSKKLRDRKQMRSSDPSDLNDTNTQYTHNPPLPANQRTERGKLSSLF